MGSDYIQELENVINKFSYIINKYREKDNIEIHLRLGINDEEDGFIDGFNCEQFYVKVLNTFKNCKEWEKIENESFYNNYNNSVNYIYYKTFDNQNCIKMEIIETYVFKYNNTPYDFQILIFKISEFKDFKNLDKNDPIVSILKYKCDNFYIRNNKIQLYIEEKDDREVIEINHGVNLSFIDLKKCNYNSKYLAHDMLLRIRDVIDICEKIQKNTSIVSI